jgi:predicted metal-dependent enzyme (double-stranded beta helix superfamily)
MLWRDPMPLVTEERLIAESENALTPNPAEGKTPQELAEIVSRFAASDGWIDRVRLRTENRWYERLYLGTDYDVWAISWMPAQSTGFHDHGDSAGAFVVATGVLEEHRPGAATIEITPGKTRAFGKEYAHDVRNASLGPAISIHAYSPPLNQMNEYDLVGSELVSREQPSPRAESLTKERHQRKPPQSTRASNIDLMLAEARDRLRRLSPSAAFDAV